MSRIGRECEVCGSNFNAVGGAPGRQRTCSRACGMKIHAGVLAPRLIKIELKPVKVARLGECAWCRHPFLGDGRFCGRRCSDAHYNAMRPRPWMDRVKSPVSCKGCEAMFLPTHPGQLHCSPRCGKRARRRLRRARKLGIAHEPYTLDQIARRDRFRCGLCRKRVAMTKQVPHPKAPTIDHVVPLVDGGDDLRANVQLAHFECNWKKAAGGTQQLALIG